MTKTIDPQKGTPSTRAQIAGLPGFPVTVKHILAPTDLTEDSRKGLHYAIRLASHFNARLTVLHVVDRPDVRDYLIGQSVPTDPPPELQAAEQRLDSFVEELKQQYREVDSTVVIGNVCSQIVDLANLFESDLIVVSTHNYSWFKRLMAGRDAEKIARNAPCPILIVHQRERDFIG
jgi:nucleotide-binding universal stress UspA family protein